MGMSRMEEPEENSEVGLYEWQMLVAPRLEDA